MEPGMVREWSGNGAGEGRRERSRFPGASGREPRPLARLFEKAREGRALRAAPRGAGGGGGSVRGGCGAPSGVREALRSEKYMANLRAIPTLSVTPKHGVSRPVFP
ncbi:unnamed protein product [Coccothraustes coccothraustes]